MSSTLNVVITGGNTGIGFGIARGLLASTKPYNILITSRSLARSKSAVEQLQSEIDSSPGSRVNAFELDIESDISVEAFREVVEKDYGHVDILLNNAGAVFDMEPNPKDAWTKAFNLNVIGTQTFTRAMVPLVLKSQEPRILFISSSTGSLGNHVQGVLPLDISPPAGWPKPPAFSAPSYRSSKTALNMLAREWKRILHNDGVKVHIICPGMVATTFGGADPEKQRAKGAGDPYDAGKFITTIAEGAQDDKQGIFIDKNGVLPW